jgi:hypothetical protein
MKALQLVVREGCHLCDEFEDLLEHHPLRGRFALERVVINRDESLEALYGHKVPVLLNGNTWLCHYYLDEDALLGALES